MRTSLNDIAQTETYLRHEMLPQDSLVFQAKLLTNPVLRMNTFFQQKIYSLVKAYHRKKLKEEAEDVYQQLCADPEFAEWHQNVSKLFK